VAALYVKKFSHHDEIEWETVIIRERKMENTGKWLCEKKFQPIKRHEGKS